MERGEGQLSEASFKRKKKKSKREDTLQKKKERTGDPHSPSLIHTATPG